MRRDRHTQDLPRGPTVSLLNEIRALARKLDVMLDTPKTAEEAERQLAALKAYEADG